MKRLFFRTANSAEMRLSVGLSTANIAAVENGAWALIAPYGDHPSPDGTYVQRFDRDQAAKVVKTWNSITGVAARFFKNLAHGLGPKRSVPVWDGHPDDDKQRWPVERMLAEVSDVRAGVEGLDGLVTWNAKGAERRTRGPLYPSALWWHWPPAGEPPAVYPELLESVGLVPSPNISAVPAWTANATFAGPAETQNPMTEEQHRNWAALRTALGCAENADAAAVILAATTANAAVGQLTERETALSTANSAKSDLETKLTNANGQVSTLTGERDQLKTANGALTTEVETLRTGVLELAELRGAITPAERETYKGKLATANAAATTIAELKTRKAMNTEPVVINGNRVDLSTANARQGALRAEVARRMKANGVDYDTAFAEVLADPAFGAVAAAMHDPTRRAA